MTPNVRRITCFVVFEPLLYHPTPRIRSLRQIYFYKHFRVHDMIVTTYAILEMGQGRGGGSRHA